MQPVECYELFSFFSLYFLVANRHRRGVKWSITTEKETVLYGIWVLLRVNTTDKCTQNINAVVINMAENMYIN
jgi:hypothetical protein